MTKSKVFHFEAEKKYLLYAINFKTSSTTKTARQVLSIISSTVRNCAEIPDVLEMSRMLNWPF